MVFSGAMYILASLLLKIVSLWCYQFDSFRKKRKYRRTPGIFIGHRRVHSHYILFGSLCMWLSLVLCGFGLCLLCIGNHVTQIGQWNMPNIITDLIVSMSQLCTLCSLWIVLEVRARATMHSPNILEKIRWSNMRFDYVYMSMQRVNGLHSHFNCLYIYSLGSNACNTASILTY